MPLDSANGVSAPSRMILPAQTNLLQRLLSSAVLLPVIGLTVWLGGIWVVLLVAGCTLLGIHELYQLFTHMGHRPRTIGYLCGILFIVAAWQATSQRDLAGPVLAAT